MFRKERETKQNENQVQIKKEIKDLPEQKIANYSDLELTKL